VVMYIFVIINTGKSLLHNLPLISMGVLKTWFGEN
jgi:hypothetical protein